MGNLSIWEAGWRYSYKFLWREGEDLYSIEDAIRLEELQENENSFYDVFEKYTEEEIIEYKRMAGIPITESSKIF